MVDFILPLYIDSAHSNERIPISICPLVGRVGVRKRRYIDWNTLGFVDTTYP